MKYSIINKQLTKHGAYEILISCETWNGEGILLFNSY